MDSGKDLDKQRKTSRTILFGLRIANADMSFSRQTNDNYSRIIFIEEQIRARK